MSKIKASLLVPAVVLVFGLSGARVGSASDTRLMGGVKSEDGKPLDGVAVSARAGGKTYTTTVFTDEAGNYFFPPLERGPYRIWAQAVGFETARAELDLDASRFDSLRSLTAGQEAQQDFTLRPLADFSMQLSGTEWIVALPEDTPQNRRMKVIFRNNCAGCHQTNFVLQNRFDEAGWRKVIELMERVGIYGEPPRPDLAPLPLLRHFKDELVAYLARMRGPGPSPMNFKPFPRPRGEVAQVVITEYDITSNYNIGEFVTQDGSDWMEGVPSAYEARGPHDAEVDANGFVWIADSQRNPFRTVARLDPKTGQVKNYKLESPRDGWAMRSHGIVIDHKGIAWFNADGGLGKLDTKTEKLEWFEPPKGMAQVGGTLDVDAAGNVWASTNEGAIRFGPTTHTFTEFKSLHQGFEGRTYGVAVDSQGNCWWAQMNYDVLGFSDIRTGKSMELVLPPRPVPAGVATEMDRQVYRFARADWNSAPAWQLGPRRLGADKKGNTVWVANWWGDNLAKIDIKTRQVTYYPYPSPGFGGVYDTVVDKNGMVWMNLMNADRVARFDPKTERWTQFVLPTLGTETRFIAVDNHKNPIEVWTPYWRTSKVARLQFRTREQLQALNARAQLRAQR